MKVGYGLIKKAATRAVPLRPVSFGSRINVNNTAALPLSGIKHKYVAAVPMTPVPLPVNANVVPRSVAGSNGLRNWAWDKAKRYYLPSLRTLGLNAAYGLGTGIIGGLGYKELAGYMNPVDTYVVDNLRRYGYNNTANALEFIRGPREWVQDAGEFVGEHGAQMFR